MGASKLNDVCVAQANAEGARLGLNGRTRQLDHSTVLIMRTICIHGLKITRTPRRFENKE
jgi:hypothetical protein